VIHGCGVAASLIDMGIREIHEDDDDHGTRNGEGHMVEKEATPQVAARAKRLNRRLDSWLRVHVVALFETVNSCVCCGVAKTRT
jgi:hypothetical protein